MNLYADEMLDQIDKAEGEAKVTLLKKYGAGFPLNMILSLNFDNSIKLDLPEGMPPYNRDETRHPDTYNTLLQQEVKRLKSLLVGATPSLPKAKKESIFIQILEGISAKEGDVLIFAKDKALGELYPSITKDFVKKEFPNYCRE